MSATIRSWDRMPEESAEQFELFCMFRDLGVRRSIRKAYFAVYPESTHVNGTVLKWSGQFNWINRAVDYDAFMADIKTAERTRYESEEVDITERNAQSFRDNELYLAEQAARKASEILSIPLTRRSFVEYADKKTIIHKPHIVSPGHLMAAAALAKLSSDLGRRALGMKDDDASAMTPERFKKLFYKSTGELAKDLTPGMLPQLPDEAAVNPGVKSAEEIKATNSDLVQTMKIEKVRGERERP